MCLCARIYEVLGTALRALRVRSKHSTSGDLYPALKECFIKLFKRAAQWNATPLPARPWLATLPGVQPSLFFPILCFHQGDLRREEASIPCYLILTAGTACTQIRGPPACHSSLVPVIFSFCQAQDLLGVGLCHRWLCTQGMLKIRVTLLPWLSLALWMLGVGGSW